MMMVRTAISTVAMTLNDIDYSFVVDMLSYMLCYKGRYQIEGEKVHNVNIMI